MPLLDPTLCGENGDLRKRSEDESGLQSRRDLRCPRRL